MKRSLFLWCFGGFTFSTALGTLLHFLYSWTNLLVFAPISAVNESTWEHIKILFFPMLIFGVFQSFFYAEYQGFWWIKFIGVFVSIITMPILFYTVNGAIGKTPDFINIFIFFISAGIGYFIEGILLKNNLVLPLKFIPIITLFLIGIFFVYFTFFPLKIPLFLDPLSNTYGIKI